MVKRRRDQASLKFNPKPNWVQKIIRKRKPCNSNNNPLFSNQSLKIPKKFPLQKWNKEKSTQQKTPNFNFINQPDKREDYSFSSKNPNLLLSSLHNMFLFLHEPNPWQEMQSWCRAIESPTIEGAKAWRTGAEAIEGAKARRTGAEALNFLCKASPQNVFRQNSSLLQKRKQKTPKPWHRGSLCDSKTLHTTYTSSHHHSSLTSVAKSRGRRQRGSS